MNAATLRQKLGELASAHDKELDESEKLLRGKYRLLRRAVFQEAGEQVAIEAEYEHEYYDFWPPKSDLPPGAPIVEYD